MAPELAEIHFIEPRPVERAERLFVFLNMAASLDGKIATADRRESRLGSRRDARRLLALRAAADAILCGGRTIRAENADLRLRSPPHRRWRERHRSAQPPLRIVASAEADLPPDLRLFAPGGPPLLLLTTPRAPERRLRELQRRTAAILVAPESPPGLPAALAWLR
ncbi:MAG: dihydrofolate reductase family protein, partial [Verrucomicrobia bacterium]|nr:dihydrofolate reductase family protein [Verrucomicrobiota bacterium]